jgi:antitoxin (DNA-binding transcriptional repressor) of toxin-antitoxin stability system
MESKKRPDDTAWTPRSVSATEGAKRFARIVDSVRESAASYVVTRAGVPVAEIGPVKARRFTAGDFARLLESLPPSDDAFERAVREGRSRMNRRAIPGSRWPR